MNEPEKQEFKLNFAVPSGYRDEARLDMYLTSHIQNATRAKVQKGIKEGRVTVNGRVAKKGSYTVQAGDKIEALVLKPPPMELLPEDIPLDILFEDKYLLVVNKPAGMVVHPAYGNRTGTLVHALLHHVGSGKVEMDAPDRETLSDQVVGLSILNAGSEGDDAHIVRPGIVHRLDKDTTGALVVAKDDTVHAHLARQFAQRSIEREYRAIVWGNPKPAEGRIESFLGRDARDRRRVAPTDDNHGKLAITNYQTIESLGHTALLSFKLETGRTHQIRAHAKQIGHPVIGDAMYGGDVVLKGPQTGPRAAFFKRLFDLLPRQALHALTLGFVHPITNEDIRTTAPIPKDMETILKELRTQDPY